MRSLLYIVAVILVVGWLIGFIGYHASGAIHLLLVLAIIAIVINVMQGKKTV
ncbi:MULTISPECIES: lmo0937 family membrane protein [Niastella]|uniref:Lmo0937 family membrane protein n=1 Tax=Niastella soli TaxID=2821487 RepID=A0ABS3YYT6_9BACT|nr:lmo0937 family membrane protein [Niastella soli]MBO9203087.1 lmo0937 family membrane protein [Niastella soli]